VVCAWLGTLVIPPVMLAAARQSWLAALDRPEQQAGWDAFRGEMRRQSGREGPVQRKVPKSAEPPARVWLRDYFPLAVLAWILFVGVLGGFFCMLVAGALRSPPAGTPSPPGGTPSPPGGTPSPPEETPSPPEAMPGPPEAIPGPPGAGG
jgi:hypothetical protein